MTDTPISLREHFDGRLAGQEKAVNERFESYEKAVAAALAAAKEAVSKAEAATERRFESVNEFRGTLSDQANTFLTRVEYNAAHQTLVEKVEGLQKFMWMGLGAVMAIQLFIGIVFLVVKKP